MTTSYFQRINLLSWALCALLSSFAGCASEDDPAVQGEEAVTCNEGTCEVVGPLVGEMTFRAENLYILRTAVYVGAEDGTPGTLTIEPGTVIQGDTATLTFLSVRRGSKIQANGTAQRPIVFTSAKPAGSRAAGDWGGLILNGSAPSNACPNLDVCEVEGEGGGGVYGGKNTADSSGSMKFVRVEFAGKQITDENELNGIAFQGVGSGTVIEDIHVHMSKDDGIEFFGGNVAIKRVLLTCIGDDSLDWTGGWSGKAQFVAIRQCEGDGDNGIEADSSKSDTATPRSNPVLSNLTLVGQGNTDYGLLLRVGTAGQIWNSIVMGFGETCVGIDGDNTFKQASAGALVIKNTMVQCASTSFCDARAIGEGQDCTTAGLDHAATENVFMGQSSNRRDIDPQLANQGDATLGGLDLRPASNSPAAGIGAGPSDPFFEPVDYAGAFKPGAQQNWAGWTLAPMN